MTPDFLDFLRSEKLKFSVIIHFDDNNNSNNNLIIGETNVSLCRLLESEHGITGSFEIFEPNQGSHFIYFIFILFYFIEFYDVFLKFNLK